jgi:hypothetical protein
VGDELSCSKVSVKLTPSFQINQAWHNASTFKEAIMANHIGREVLSENEAYWLLHVEKWKRSAPGLNFSGFPEPWTTGRSTFRYRYGSSPISWFCICLFVTARLGNINLSGKAAYGLGVARAKVACRKDYLRFYGFFGEGFRYLFPHPWTCA